jgi:hypothetical protein
VGTGCYRVYRGKAFNGAFFTLEGSSRADLKEQNFPSTTIK